MLRERSETAISIDTSKAEVARAALEAGAEIINDVTALTSDPSMAAVAAESKAGVVLMHMHGTPRSMQKDPRYEDVVLEVKDYLASRLVTAGKAGIEEERIAVDPGIGFGKTADHNWALIRELGVFAQWGRPVLLGVSRKSLLKDIAGDDMSRRDAATAALTAILARGGSCRLSYSLLRLSRWTTNELLMISMMRCPGSTLSESASILPSSPMTNTAKLPCTP
jgi:dihydropteroate synthase